MAELLYEDCEGSDGTSVSTSNSEVDTTPTGSGTSHVSEFDTAFFKVGTSSIRYATTAGIRTNRFNVTTSSTLWLVFYMRIQTLPDVDFPLFQVWNGTTGQFIQLWLRATGTLDPRSGSGSSQFQTTALPTGEWVRVAFYADYATNTVQVKTYRGTNVDGAVIDTGQGSTDNTDNSFTWGANATFDNIRCGILASSPTAEWNVDDIHADDSTEWIPEQPGYTPFIVHGQVNL